MSAASVRGLRLGVDQRLELRVRHCGGAHVEQEIEHFGRGDEVASREPLERFVDQRDDPGLVHLVLLVLSMQRTRLRPPSCNTPTDVTVPVPRNWLPVGRKSYTASALAS